MAWSAENATKAYLRTLKMGKRAKEPDVAEYVSALAAGNGAQLMVEACSGTAGATTQALAAAAHQTGGRVVCILRGLDELRSSNKALGPEANHIEFVIGDARTLLLNEYRGADFVLIDCTLEDHEGVYRAAQAAGSHRGAFVVGYNAFCKGSLWRGGLRTDFLPIGDGLQVTRVQASGGARRSRWVVRIDQCTGEEHVFRITSPQRKVVEA